MINMIKADFYRIFKGAGIYIAFGVLALIIAMSIYTVSPGSVGMASVGNISTVEDADSSYDTVAEDGHIMSVGEIREIRLKMKDYPLDIDILTANMNLYYVLIFLGAIVVTAEFSSGSIKNTLSSAISRNKYFASKTTVILILGLFLFFLNTYIIYFSNIIFNGENLASDLWSVTKISLLQLPPIIALLSILSGIAFMFKKTAAYNMIAIPFVVIFQLVFNFCMQLFSIDPKFAGYELQNMIKMLALEPTGEYIIKSYIVCAVIIVGCNLVGYLSFKKSEIK